MSNAGILREMPLVKKSPHCCHCMEAVTRHGEEVTDREGLIHAVVN
jgi:hypothetical protein